MIITGIGSRQAPEEVLVLFEQLGNEVRERDWWLRSGHAEGCDYAFERGAKKHCIVYLPWDGFNKNLLLWGIPRYSDLRDDALDIVNKHESGVKDRSQGVQRIKQRNVFQVLGEDLNTPSDLVVCWTEDGKVVGGTGLAIKIAKAHEIPIINVGDPKVEVNLDRVLQEVLNDN